LFIRGAGLDSQLFVAFLSIFVVFEQYAEREPDSARHRSQKAKQIAMTNDRSSTCSTHINPVSRKFAGSKLRQVRVLEKRRLPVEYYSAPFVPDEERERSSCFCSEFLL
jgi:hypothetical protein